MRENEENLLDRIEELEADVVNEQEKKRNT